MTHNLKDKNTGRYLNNSEIFRKFRFSIDPLIKESRLSCVLAQFPFSFHYNEENKAYLDKFKYLMGNIPLVMEFRNIGWNNLDALNCLKGLGIGYCIVDEPKLKGLMPFVPAVTSDIGYFRFHGRNTNWFDAPASLRYDYFYSEKELKEFIPSIIKAAKETKKALVFFNNCHAGSAAKNAIQLMKILKDI